MNDGESNFKYLIMEFLELSMYKYETEGMSFGQLSINMLRCIEAFHKDGYVHCDVKESNFRINNRILYLIDYGMSAKYRNSDGSHIKCGNPRVLKGNTLYSSLNWEQGLDLSRRDDLISMIFNLIYIVEGGLLW